MNFPVQTLKFFCKIREGEGLLEGDAISFKFISNSRRCRETFEIMRAVQSSSRNTFGDE
jgi:hypothetical protein